MMCQSSIFTIKTDAVISHSTINGVIWTFLQKHQEQPCEDVRSLNRRECCMISCTDFISILDLLSFYQTENSLCMLTFESQVEQCFKKIKLKIMCNNR